MSAVVTNIASMYHQVYRSEKVSQAVICKPNLE